MILSRPCSVQGLPASLLASTRRICGMSTMHQFIASVHPIVRSQLYNWKNVSTRYALTQCHLYFLTQCRREGLLPKFICQKKVKIIIKVDRLNSRLNRIQNRFHFKVLNLIIKEKFTLLNQYKNQLNVIVHKLQFLVGHDALLRFFDEQRRSIHQKCVLDIENKNKKLDMLRRIIAPGNDVNYNCSEVVNGFGFGEKIYNLTSIDLPIQLINTLKLGINFNFPLENSQKCDVVHHTIKEVENIAYKLVKETQNDIRKEVANTLQEFLMKPIRHSVYERGILHDLRVSKKKKNFC